MINRRSVKGKHATPTSPPAERESLVTGPYPPLVQLLALLPLVVFYEAAVPWTTDRTHFYHRIDAWSQWLLSHIGLTAYYLPGLLILAALLLLHLVRRDRWTVSPAQAGRLWLDALLWLVPLFVLYLLFTMPVRQLLGMVLQTSGNGPPDLFANVVLSIGAGLFEEFVFRLLLVSLLLWVLERLLGVPKDPAQLVAICFSAALFASAHFFGPSAEPFTYLGFLFRAAAGIYLGAVFMLRGFATGAIVHAAFNVVLALLAT
jgi:membrane protease YdiL (CAAX protease family)